MLLRPPTWSEIEKYTDDPTFIRSEEWCDLGSGLSYQYDDRYHMITLTDGMYIYDIILEGRYSGDHNLVQISGWLHKPLLEILRREF